MFTVVRFYETLALFIKIGNLNFYTIRRFNMIAGKNKKLSIYLIFSILFCFKYPAAAEAAARPL